MKTSKYFSIIFIIILYSLNFGIYINYINAYINKKTERSSTPIIEEKKSSNYVDWKKEYPINKTNEFKLNNEKKR